MAGGVLVALVVVGTVPLSRGATCRTALGLAREIRMVSGPTPGRERPPRPRSTRAPSSASRGPRAPRGAGGRQPRHKGRPRGGKPAFDLALMDANVTYVPETEMALRFRAAVVDSGVDDEMASVLTSARALENPRERRGCMTGARSPVRPQGAPSTCTRWAAPTTQRSSEEFSKCSSRTSRKISGGP